MGEMCFEGLLKRGFEVLALGEMCFEGMGAVEKRCWHLKCVFTHMPTPQTPFSGAPMP